MNRFCSSIYCINQGEVLLINHNKLGIWLPVGGKQEKDESPFMTAARELREETGIVDTIFPNGLGVGSPPGYFGYTEYPTPWGDLHMVHMFLARVPSREIKNDKKEFATWDWFNPLAMAELPNTTDNVRWAGRQIAQLINDNGEKYSRTDTLRCPACGGHDVTEVATCCTCRTSWVSQMNRELPPKAED